MTKLSTTSNAEHGQQAPLDNAIPQTNSSVINECWSIALDGINELLPLFFAQLDDGLFKLSENAETNAQQAVLFETMRFFRREQEGMRTKYIQNLYKKYTDYWDKPSNTLQVSGNVGKADVMELSLVEETIFEETLAVNGMIEKGNALYQAQLFPLNKRFCWLSGKDSETESLPLSPEVLCKQFLSVFGSMEVDLKVKLLVYKLFDHQLLSKLEAVYQNLNAHLAAKGVLPTIASTIIKQKSREYADRADSLAQPTSADGIAEISAYMDTFRAMQSLMDGWRQRLGVPALPAAIPGAAIADSDAVIGVIDSLQHSFGGDGAGQLLSAENLKQNVALQLGKVQGNQLGRTMGRPEEDVIDMVGIIFDFILDDKNVAAPIKGLIARLQIPIIKVAILDKTFFAKKNHASRILLNDLAQAGISLTAEEANADNPVVQKVEEVVSKIINEFSQDITLFDDVLKDFSAFMEKESKRSALAENRILQTTQSKERIWLAKKAVAAEITKRLQNVDAPLSFRTFIYNDWKDVLFLAYLRRDKDDSEWDRHLETLDKMVWSITPPANSQERVRLIREIPAITKAVREGLHSTSLDAHQIKSLLKELQLCHMEALHPDALLKSSGKPAKTQEAEAVLPSHGVDIKDAELAEAILEVKSHLPDIANIDMNEMIMGGADAISQKEAAGWLANFVKDQHWEAVNRLKVGDWVEFTNEDSALGRAKLAWKSPSTSLCVFVNRRGIKVLEVKLGELASRMRQGRAHVIESANIPLMDRAVSFMTQSLQNPFSKTAESPFYA